MSQLRGRYNPPMTETRPDIIKSHNRKPVCRDMLRQPLTTVSTLKQIKSPSFSFLLVSALPVQGCDSASQPST